MSERNCPACGGSGYTTQGVFTENQGCIGTSPCYLCNSPKQRLLTEDEESAPSKALKRSTKEIKRPITKADIDEYCKANGMVLLPEETINKMEDLYGILDETHKRLKHETEDILGGIIDDIAAFKVQAL